MNTKIRSIALAVRAVPAFAASICAVSLLAASAVTAAPASASRTDAEFKKTFEQVFLPAYWQINPDTAVAMGYYQVADRLAVPDAAARARQLAFLDKWQKALHRYDPAKLDIANRADWAILDNDFEYERWLLNDFRAWQWDPSGYNVADPFALILTTSYAPLEQRLRSVSTRLQNVPAYYEAAKRNIDHPTREHTELAITQSQGALGVFGADLNQQIAASKLGATEREVLTQRAAAARTAIQGYIDWLKMLDEKLAQEGARSWRIGKTLYDKKFDYEIRSGDSAEALYQRALQEKERLLARMSLLSDELWPKYFSNLPKPEDRLKKIAALIGKLSEQHAPREKFFETVQGLVPDMQRWVVDHKLLDLDASRPLEVRVTPKYKQGVAGASLDAPGPYDPTARSFFNVTPLDDVSADAAESSMREYNRWMLPILVIHEAIPGHYVQLLYANKSPSLIKTIFANGAMIEGWAVYGERMMIESGYGDDTAEMWLIYSKWNLRSVCNTLLDYSLQVLNMSEADARNLLLNEAFQAQSEVNEKWHRAMVSSVQLTSYYSGYSAIYELRERLKKQRGERFDLKNFHEEFLSYGSAPVGVIDKLMTSNKD